MSPADMVGFIAATLSASIALPQLVRVIKRQPMGDTSVGVWILLLGNAVAWVVWALLVGQYVAAVPSFINGPIAAIVLIRLWKERRTAPRLSVMPTP